MNEFSHIPLTPSYVISNAGRILPDCISIEVINDTTFILIGNCEGELWLYTMDDYIPKKHASYLGGIAIVTIKPLNFFKKQMAIVIALENHCSFFEIEGKSNEWIPLIRQPLIFNPCCYLIFEGKSGSEILLGTQNGGLGYFVENSSKPDTVWRYSNFWSLKYEVTSIVQVKNYSFIIGRGDGNAFLFNLKENPERVANFLPALGTKDPSSVLLSYSQRTNNVLAVNGVGKVSLFQLEGKEVLTVDLTKRPIFVDFWLDECGKEIPVVGTPDGCVYFWTGERKNVYRHEELIQSIYMAKSGKFILVIVGQSGVVSFFTKIVLLDIRIPRFVEFVGKELEELRSMIGDRDTPDENFISTYLYMPLH